MRIFKKWYGTAASNLKMSILKEKYGTVVSRTTLDTMPAFKVWDLTIEIASRYTMTIKATQFKSAQFISRRKDTILETIVPTMTSPQLTVNSMRSATSIPMLLGDRIIAVDCIRLIVSELLQAYQMIQPQSVDMRTHTPPLRAHAGDVSVEAVNRRDGNVKQFKCFVMSVLHSARLCPQSHKLHLY